MRRGFIVVLILVAISCMAASYADNAKHKKTESPKTATTSEQNFSVDHLFSTLDGYRIYQGINGLQRDFTLDRAAQLHAEDMKQRHYYSHTTPDGVTAYQRIDNAIGKEVYAGENQDNVCTSPSETDEFSRFVDSPEHNDNMLDPKFNTVGIGYAPSDPGQCNGYLVFDFAGI